MELFGALQSLGSKLASILPNIVLRMIYSEAYFKSHILINMGDSTPSLLLYPEEHRMTDLQVAITNLLPFKIEISFNRIEISIGQYPAIPISVNQTHDILRISRQSQMLPFGDIPNGAVSRTLESQNPHPLLDFVCFLPRASCVMDI